VGILAALHNGFLVKPWHRNVAFAICKEPKWFARDWSQRTISLRTFGAGLIGRFAASFNRALRRWFNRALRRWFDRPLCGLVQSHLRCWFNRALRRWFNRAFGAGLIAAEPLVQSAALRPRLIAACAAGLIGRLAALVQTRLAPLV
jgi:hypothetical protein